MSIESVDIHKSVKLGQNVHFESDTVLKEGVCVGNNVTFYPKVVIEAGVTIFDGAVIGRPPMSTGNVTRKVDSSFRPLVIGEGSIIGANAVLYTGIRIGKNVLIGDAAQIREGCDISEAVVIGRSVNVMYDTKIGERTRIIDVSIITGNMTIEPDVFIGPGVNTINDDQPYLTRYGLDNWIVKGPTIRRFALVGAGANLRANIEVGMGAIVAPNATVIKDVLPWTVVGGTPAEFIRDIPQNIKEKLLRHFGIDPEDITPASQRKGP